MLLKRNQVSDIEDIISEENKLPIKLIITVSNTSIYVS